MLMYVSSQKLDKDIKEFYANDYKTQSLSEESHDYLFLLFLVPVIFIFVLSNISNRLSSMKSDMRQRGSLSDGNLAIISITVYVALFLSFIFLPIFVPGIFSGAMTEEELFRTAVWRWAACFFVLLHLLTVFLRWRKIGNPQNVLSFPVTKFEIPKQISPTASFYLIRQGNVDPNRLLITVFFSLICKGLLLINGPKIQRSGKEVGEISNDEIFFLKYFKLESTGSVFKIEENSENWASRMRIFKDRLVDHLDDEIFDFITHNVKQIRRDMLVTIMLLMFFTIGAISGFYWFLIIPPVFIALFRSNQTIKYFFGCVFFIVNAFAFNSPDLQNYFLYNLPWILVGTLSIITLLMITELRNFSAEGARIVDHLRGLDLFMSSSRRSSDAGVPTPSLKQFLAIFPYALAMQSQKAWIKKFENELPVWQNANENNQLSQDYESDALPLSAVINYADIEKQFFGALNFREPPPTSSG